MAENYEKIVEVHYCRDDEFSKSLAANVSQLGEVADFKALTLFLAEFKIWKLNLLFSTEPAILPNCC